MPSELGNGAMYLEYYNNALDHGVFSWTVLAYLVGKGNGCPRVTQNLKKGSAFLAEVSDNPFEQAAEVYVRKHMPHNFWWGMLRMRAGELENTPLLEDMALVPESFDVEAENFDAECVDGEYKQGRKYGLTTDEAFGVTSHIVAALEGGEIGFLELLQVIDGALEKCVTVKELRTYLSEPYEESQSVEI